MHGKASKLLRKYAAQTGLAIGTLKRWWLTLNESQRREERRRIERELGLDRRGGEGRDAGD